MRPGRGGEAGQPRGWVGGWVCVPGRRGAAGCSSTKGQRRDALRVPPQAMPAGTADPPALTRGKGGGGAEEATGPTGEGERAVPGPCCRPLRRPPPDTIGATAAPLPARPAAQGGGDGSSIILTHPSEEARRGGEGPWLAGAQRAGIPRAAGARAERAVSLRQRPRRYSRHIAAGNGTAPPRRTAHAPGPGGGGAALRLRRPETIALSGLRALPARAMAGGERRFPPRSAPAVTEPALSPLRARGRRRTGRAVRRRDCGRDPQQRGDGLRRPPSLSCRGWAVGGDSASGGAVHAGTCSPGGSIPALGKRDGPLALLVSATAAGDSSWPSGAGGTTAGGSCESPTREGRKGGTPIPQSPRGESPGASGVLMRAPRGERALEESLERYQRRLRGERGKDGPSPAVPAPGRAGPAANREVAPSSPHTRAWAPSLRLLSGRAAAASGAVLVPMRVLAILVPSDSSRGKDQGTNGF